MIEHRSYVWLTALMLAGCGNEGGDSTGDGTGTTGATTMQTTDPTTGTAATTPPTTGDTGTGTGDPTGTGETGDTGVTSITSVTGDTGTADTGDTGTEDTGPPPVTAVPVFLAQGHHGRTTISCDDGKTWIQNRSADDNVRCFENDLDCDHEAQAARGIAWGDGVFVLTWGWGKPGTLVRSEDASTFDIVMSETPTFADVAYGAGRFVANGGTTKVSDDLGLTWADGGPLDIDINTRSIEYFPHGDGVYIVTGESGDQRTIIRSPDGVTWTPASQRPPECGTYAYGMAHGDGTIILASGKGGICRSQDGGDTWEHTNVTEQFSSPPVWTGAEFYIYDGATLWHSADGAEWTSEGVTPDSVRIGALARSPEGTLVAANAGWMTWYEKQQFYRSTDGKTWEVLAPGAFVGSHPINFISHGTVSPGAGCPAP
jgi:hypothetical protein